MKSESFGKRVANYYRSLALIVLNTIVVLIVINLSASGGY